MKTAVALMRKNRTTMPRTVALRRHEANVFAMAVEHFEPAFDQG